MPAQSTVFQLATLYAGYIESMLPGYAMESLPVRSYAEGMSASDSPVPRIVVDALQNESDSSRAKKFSVRLKLVTQTGPQGTPAADVEAWHKNLELMAKDEFAYFQYVQTVAAIELRTGWTTLKKLVMTPEDLVESESSVREYSVVIALTLAVS